VQELAIVFQLAQAARGEVGWRALGGAAGWRALVRERRLRREPLVHSPHDLARVVLADVAQPVVKIGRPDYDSGRRVGVAGGDEELGLEKVGALLRA
jgi:hypothetical protein